MRRADFSISLLVAVTLVVAISAILGVLGIRDYAADRERLTRLLNREHAMTANELAVSSSAPLQSGEAHKSTPCCSALCKRNKSPCSPR